MEIFLKNAQQIHPLSTELIEHLSTVVKVLKLSNGHILLKERDIAKHIYFIEQGFARCYYMKDGKDITQWFMSTGDAMISVFSFFNQTPSLEYIELLEDSVLLCTSYADLQELYRKFPEFNVIGRVLTEKYYILSEERAIALRSMTAQERYADLLKKHPKILQKASLKHISSYLGIAPETLSRIRAKK
ncbi:Crp/Fnr family transcriptional regulator [Pedobacter boryungensis]|uniref:Crp/Fnr family transcriptional regulator n=1 Tax=Pedobacter boryungensis TaxID=869962 RepID=A0ABX2DD18_9SPHI|nr:Crp/Fnr family transcriptional regulator [Pedobacter boryungensis]NQX31702.1 Crp/Fnr family transcriptional regulator [Pedobacter boryungensis]